MKRKIKTRKQTNISFEIMLKYMKVGEMAGYYHGRLDERDRRTDYYTGKNIMPPKKKLKGK